VAEVNKLVVLIYRSILAKIMGLILNSLCASTSRCLSICAPGSH